MTNHTHQHACEHKHNPVENKAKSTDNLDFTTSQARWDSLLIKDMDCPTEERLIRDKFKDITAIEQLEFNLIKRVLKVRHSYTSIEPLQHLIAELGMQAVPYDNSQIMHVNTSFKSTVMLIIAGFLAFTAEIMHYLAMPTLLVAIISLCTIALVGLPTYYKGFIALKNKALNINALMSIAVTGAIFIGQWPEAAMVIVLFTLAEYIETLSLQRARNAIGELLQLAPTTAEVQQADGSWQTIAAEQISLDSIIRVKPGQRVALDGEIISGQTTIDQAAITGESMPVEKTVGDPVFAGTVNGNQAFTFKVTRVANDTTLARIIQRVEEAQSSRAPTQRFVDQFSKYYTPIVVAIALVIALITIPAWLYTNQFTIDWIYKALVLLVIACPCALVISTPVTIVSGLTRAAKLGILIKGGTYLEQGSKLQWLAVDKTGTLTAGKPSQTDYQALVEINAQQIAGSLASHSDHPVSIAIAQATLSPLLTVENFEAILGQGTQGIINGQQYYLGNYRLIRELGLATEPLSQQLQLLEKAGKTTTLLATSTQVIAIFAVADTLKETSKQAINELHRLGIKVMMLTGDNQYTANAIAQQVGIDEAKANLLPDDKLTAIELKIKQGQSIGMVGDGINDTPALARANIGFAMGAAGTDTAIETADVALMDDDLRKLPLFIRLSKATRHILIQNISFAIAIKLLFLIITLLGFGTLWMAIFADIGVSLLVVFNGLRLLMFK
ncbi:heavy metal translocating P-type ATPase [Entomomonas asaccharolytica]|uniref:Heavy metal translocating P-type ATPase n=1 Tax=Entomomonas asaccharolytica TaxID=2785331 RepID=A0A974NDT2_9GAMM|nr:heavy metal translocating P-type ATPase [Entomomonas asaccharolytica]QQP84838.1 heavy metal translocating P-type ATPase [Entomomonas asaccharolytica]